MQRKYWHFYWPLAVTGLVMLLGTQFQNGVLASYGDPARELSTYAYAGSTVFTFNALLVFVPQMTNVLARTRRGHRMCLRFTVAVCLAATAPVVLVALTGFGGGFLAWWFQLDGEALPVVLSYIRLLAPLILVNGLVQHYLGMLVQARRTGTVTVLNIVKTVALIGALLGAKLFGFSAVRTLTAAMLFSSGLHLVLTYAMYRLLHRFPDGEATVRLTYRQVFAFFWPVGTTSLMFAFSRPVLFSFVSRTADGEATVAALQVAFSFAMMFHNPLNQFRHLFVTFGDRDAAGKLRFMAAVTAALMAIMVLVAFTPVSRWIFHGLMNVRDELLDFACGALMVLCATPLVISIRNYFHGLLLIRRRTAGMAVGGVFRVLAIYAGSWLAYHTGLLNYAAAAAILQLGFLAEAIVSAVFSRRTPAEPPPPLEALGPM